MQGNTGYTNESNFTKSQNNLKVLHLNSESTSKVFNPDMVQFIVTSNPYDLSVSNLGQNQAKTITPQTDKYQASCSNIKEETSNKVSGKKSKKHSGKGEKKRKKTNEEVSVLEGHFTKDPAWSRKTVKALKGILTNLSVDQIYKWGYDKKLLEKKNLDKKREQKEFDKKADEIMINLPQETIVDYNNEVDGLLTPVSDTRGAKQANLDKVVKSKSYAILILYKANKFVQFFYTVSKFNIFRLLLKLNVSSYRQTQLDCKCYVIGHSEDPAHSNQ